VAAGAPRAAARLVLLPVDLATRWVMVVARLAARLDPAGGLAVAAWSVQLVALAVLWQPGRRRVRASRRRAGRAPTIEPP
jgi:hypothetical protein